MCWLRSLFGGTLEVPSPSDIIPKENITVSNTYNAVGIRIDYTRINIPFTKPPKLLSIMDIPDSNSMDGVMDYGNYPLYIEPPDAENHQIMVDWLAKEWTDSKGMLANDCVYRIMVNDTDDPKDFSKAHIFYAIHRIDKIEYDSAGRRFWRFKGVNNPRRDPYKVKDVNLLWLNTGVIY